MRTGERSKGTMLVPLGLLLVLASCAAEAPESPPFVLSDSSGVLIAQSSSPASGGERAWTLSLDPTLEIGEQGGEPEYLLSGIVGASRLDDGSLVLCNQADRTIRYYDAGGRFLRQRAGQGEGPTELRRLNRCVRRGGEIWAFQVPALPIKVFDDSGELVRAVPMPRPGGRVALLADIFEDGSLLLRQDAPRREMPQGLSMLLGVVMRAPPDEGPLDTLGTFNSGLWVRSERVAFPAAFSPTLVHVAFGDLAVLSWPERFDLAFVASDGVVTRHVRTPAVPVAVTASQTAAFTDRILNGPMPSGDTPYQRPEIRREIVDIMVYPEVLPTHYRVLAAMDGRLWVERGDAPRDPLPQVAEPYSAPTTWDVFSSEGEWLTSVVLPARFHPLEIGVSYVLGVHHDEIGVERVRVYRADEARAITATQQERVTGDGTVTPTRREFIRTAGVVGTGLVLGGTTGCREEAESGPQSAAASTPTPKKLLILGGTGFIGPHMVRYALERGHEVTIFTRGRAETEVPGEVEHLIGDRNDDHTALAGRTWDVVLDNNARDYRWVQKSTALLQDAVEQYLFVSTASVYADESMGWENAGNVLLEPIVDENSARVEAPEGWKEGDEAPYGFTKTLSENIAHAVFPGRTTVVRPGLIVGPGDTTDRFTYWPLRLEEGGEVLAPGNPEHANQIIDQRDLTEWIVRLAENGTTGNFNGAGPADRLSMRSMLEQVGSVASSPYELTWVPEAFLQEQEVRPWSDMPAWIPGDPASFVDLRASIQAGLTHRPLPVTARDTLEWDKTRPPEQRENRRAGMSREREHEVLDAWHAAR